MITCGFSGGSIAGRNKLRNTVRSRVDVTHAYVAAYGSYSVGPRLIAFLMMARRRRFLAP